MSPCHCHQLIVTCHHQNRSAIPHHRVRIKILLNFLLGLQRFRLSATAPPADRNLLRAGLPGLEAPLMREGFAPG